MTDAIRLCVRGAFAHVPRTAESLEQQDELIADLSEKLADLIEQGLSEQQALGETLMSLGDLDAFAAEFESSPIDPLTASPPQQPAAPSAAWLGLHTAVVTVLALTAAFAVASIVALSQRWLERSGIIVALGAVAVAEAAWVSAELVRLHRDRERAIQPPAAPTASLKTACAGWLGLSVGAFLLNILLPQPGFWAWIIWIAAAAIPVSVYARRRLCAVPAAERP